MSYVLKENGLINYVRLLSEPQGLILLTGPTGSGKTTTIYSLTAHCVNNLERHVITLEDPVENNHSHLLQIQVNERSGMTYSAGLKAILRHSPDVIMIGEIRDSETAKIAVQAALTGHLVLTTVHSKDPVRLFLQDDGFWYFGGRITTNNCLYFSAAPNSK